MRRRPEQRRLGVSGGADAASGDEEDALKRVEVDAGQVFTLVRRALELLKRWTPTVFERRGLVVSSLQLVLTCMSSQWPADEYLKPLEKPQWRRRRCAQACATLFEPLELL